MREKQLLSSRNTGSTLIVALFVFLQFGVTDLFAQRIASVSGNWHDTATWGGAAVPTAAESVTINSGITVTINATGAECSSISFASNSVSSFLNISGAFTLSVSGDIVFSDPSLDSRVQTISIGTGIVSCANLTFANTSASTRDNNVTISTGSLTVSGTIAMPGLTTENALICSGNSIINLGGDFTGTGAFTRGTSTLTLNGTGSQLIRGTTYRNIVINKASGVTTFSGTTSASGRLTLTSGTLDLNGATSVGSLEGSSTITNNGAANRLLTIGSDNTNTSFSGIIQNGSRVISLTKLGTGILTLSGANTYTGATTVSAGTIQLGANNVIPDLTALNITINGTLDMNGFSETIGTLAGAGTVTNTAAGAITLNAGGKNTATTTFSGVIQDGSGTLSLTKSGTGIMILSGLNSYSGSTTVSAGTLTLGTPGNGTNSPLGTIASGTTVNTGAALNLAGFTLSTAEPLTLNGTGIGVAGALINGSASSSADYSGLITLESASSIVVTSATGSLNITNPGTITGASFGLTLGGSGIGTITSIIGTGTGTLTKIGAGTWTLSADNTFSGLTTISAGTLKLGTTGNVTNGPLGTVANGVNITAGALDLNGFTLAIAEPITLRGTGIGAAGALTNSSATAVDYSGLVTLGAITTIGTNVGDLNLTHTGTITGAFALTLSGSGNGSISSIIGTGIGTVIKSGTGNWTLSGASTYTGVTTISVGTLKIGANNIGISSNSSVTVTSTLDLNGFNATIGSLAGAGAVSSSQVGSVTLTTGGKNVSTTFSGIIEDGSGTLNLTKAGTLIFTLSGLSTYSGLTTINSGTITLGAVGNGTNSPLGTIAGGTIVNTGGVLNVNGFTLLTAEPLTLNGTGISAAGALINGSATLSADYSGLITLGSASSIVSTTAARSLNITNTGTITGAGFGLTLGGAGIGTMASIIGTGAGTLTKIGEGTWTLSAANTFSGGTTLSLGILNINHAQALGNVAGTFTITAGTINNTSGSSITTLNYPMSWNGSFTFTGTNDLNLGTGAVSMNASVISTINANTLTVGGVVTGGAFNFTKAGAGTLAFGSNDVSVTDLSITAGTLISTSGTLSLADDYINNGVFTPNNGTIAFIGNTAQTIGGTVLDHVFHNFVVNKPLALTMAGGATSLTVNDYTHTTGSFTPPATFNINGNAVLTAGTLTAGATINASGNWTNNGGTLTAGAGTVNFNGTTQAIGGSSNHTFNHFTIKPTSTLTASSGIINISGNWVNDGAFVHNNGTVTFTRTTPQTLGGANSTTFYNLIENGLAGKTTLLINTSIANNLTITAGTFDIGLFTSNGNGGTFSVNNSASAIFLLQDEFPSGFATVTLGAASVITYSGATAQIIYPVAAPGYGFLNITNTVGATAGGNLVVQNSVTISSGAILDASNSGNYDISLGLNWTNNGGTFLQRAGSVTFTGTVAQAINGTALSQTFHHLTVNKTLALSVPATLNITGNLTLTSGTLTAGTSLFIAGNMTNNGGVFTAGAGTVTFNGVTQAIAGSVPITFRNITINAGSTLAGPSAMTISGAWNNNGTFAHNNGQVTFTGTTSTITSSNATESFYNFILNKTALNVLSTGGSISSLIVNDFTQTLGNFTPPANFTINGNAVFTAGTFTAGTTTNVAGNWTKVLAAIFTPGTNTVNFNGSVAQSINGTSTTQTFYNVIVNKGASSLLNTSGSTATLIVNNLTLSLGDFTAPAALTINGNATLTDGNFTAGTNITTKGDWTNNGGNFIPGLKTINFSGTGAQLINGSALTQTFYNVIINKTALSLLSVGGSNTNLIVNNFTKTQGDFSFSNALKINGFLTLTAGTFTSGSTLNIGGNWTNNSTFAHNNGTVTLDGTIAQSIGGTLATSFNNLTITNTTAAVSVNTNANIAGILNMNGIGSQLIPAAAVVFNNTAAAGSITGNGTIRITRIAPTADYLNQYKFLTNTLNNMTLNYAGAGAQTVNGGLGDYGALILSGSGVKTMPATVLNILGDFTFSGTASATALAGISVGGNVIIGAGTIFSGGAFTHNISGNWTNNGGTFTSTNSTINFRNTTSPQNINGTALTQTFFNVLLNNTGQTLSISGSTTTLSVGGDWTNNGGVFSGGAGTVSFTGLLKSIAGTSSTDFPLISIANGATLTMNNSNTSTGLNLVSLSLNSSFTHSAGAALTVNGNVNIGQPTTSVRNNSWIINAGTATVSGLITFAGANATTSRIGRITLTTGTLNANGGITFTASAAATKVIDMSGGAAILNLKGALTVPALSSTLNAGSAGSIFNYVDLDPQTINFFSAGAYNNLRINNTSAGGASLSGAITTTNLMGNLFVGNTNTASLFNTADFNIALNNSQGLSVFTGSVMNAGTTVISPATLATITVDGLFMTSNTSGFSGSVSAAINSANSPAILLGANSTVEYTAVGGGQSVSPLVYNNLTMSNTSGIQTLSGNVSVTKTLSLNSGTMEIGANILTLNGPAIAGNPTSLTANTTSSLVLGGSTAGITIPSSVTALNNLTINNITGISLNSDVSLTTNLLFSTGKLNTGSNKLILNTGATISGAGQSSGWINGNLQRNFSNADPGVFEIGDLNYYSPLTLTFTGLSVAGNITGSNSLLDHPNISTSGITASKSINQYWTLTNAGVSFSTADINFIWNTAANDVGINPANLRVAKYSSSVWTRPAVSSATSSSIQANGITSLSDFIVGEIANDFSPVITSNGGAATASLSISENGSAVTTITATDSDVVTTLSYSIIGGADAAKFNINSSTGVLTFITAPNFEVPTDADVNNIYVFTVRASDGTNNTDQTISLTILNVNEFSPIISSNGGGATASISLDENIIAVSTVVATDADTTTPTYNISSGADASKFSINSISGVLSFIVAPDFEIPSDADLNNIYIVIVRASDGTNTVEQTISTTILNANDISPVISSNGAGTTAAISLLENNSSVTTVVASDADGTTPTFSISGGADAAKFSINSSTGVLNFITSPNFEVPTDADLNNVYVLTVRASDGTNTTDQTISITILNVNEFSPVISSNGGGATATISLSENIISVTTVVATDADTTTPTYSISGGADAAKFSINSSTGVLNFITSPNFEVPTDADLNNVYVLTVRASDGTNTTDQTISITILNVNEFSPVISSNGGGATAAISISENSSAVTTVVATDADNTNPTYSISGGADALKFSINSISGVLSFIAAPDFEVPTDADANNIYLFTVRASDGTNNAEQAISLTVLNVNEFSPVITSNGGGSTAAISISENSSAITIVIATDADATTPTYSISGGADAAKFNINSTTGVLSFITAPDFELPTDADANNTYLVTIQASDGTNSVLQTLTITITDLNDNKPEIVQNQVFEIEENSAKNIVVGTVLANDKDTGTILQSWMITSGNTGNAFEINPSSGVLSVQTQNSLQFDINPTFNLNLSVSDGLNISNNQLVKINLREFIRPTITLSATAPVCQGITSVILPYTASSGSPNTYTISWNSNAQLAGFNAVSDATLNLSPINIAVPGQAAPATYSGAIVVKNANKSSVSYPISLTILAKPEIPAISGPIEVFVNKAIQLNASVAGGVWSSSSTAIASVDPVSGMVSGKTNGNTTISYLVTNNKNCSSSSSVNFTVRTDNTAISLNWVPLQVYGNDAIGTLVGTLNVSSNNPAAIFSYSLVSGTGSTDNSLFKISGNEIRIAGNLNTVQNNTFSIRVRSTDQNGISDEKILSIQVIHVNQPPVIAATANLVICSSPAPGIVNLTGISPGPESYQNVTIKLSTDNSNLFNTLSISSKDAGNAILNYTLKDGISGDATITLTLTDDGGTGNGGRDTFVSTFKITVNPAVVVSINSAAGLMISKGQTVELTASGGNSYIWANADGIISGQNTAILTVRPSHTTNYQVTVTNSFGCTATQNITLDVIEDFMAIKSTNVMSPNGDGINDTWVIENIDMYPDNEVKVYDKAGRMIFQKKGYTNTWDATLNGSNLVEGTYYYYVDLGKGQKKLKGYITIVRD